MRVVLIYFLPLHSEPYASWKPIHAVPEHVVDEATPFIEMRPIFFLVVLTHFHFSNWLLGCALKVRISELCFLWQQRSSGQDRGSHPKRYDQCQRLWRQLPCAGKCPEDVCYPDTFLPFLFPDIALSKARLVLCKIATAIPVNATAMPVNGPCLRYVFRLTSFLFLELHPSQNLAQSFEYVSINADAPQ